MLALDAKCSLANGKETSISLGDLLINKEEMKHGILITRVIIPWNIKLAFETVGRSPAGKPIVCAALVQWPSGRTRLTLGGWGKAPTLAMDGNESGGLNEAACNATNEAGDEWASTEYRMEIAGILTKRCFDRINSIKTTIISI
jgi:CO/xanthine dehydrogenase FAD-binding subunit